MSHQRRHFISSRRKLKSDKKLRIICSHDWRNCATQFFFHTQTANARKSGSRVQNCSTITTKLITTVSPLNDSWKSKTALDKKAQGFNLGARFLTKAIRV